ncbi:MAG: lipopolysaccharide assembly protein LapA domain-containing protein [Alphaproteobacteria bacterium]
MGLIRGIIGLILAVLFAVFAVANRHNVELVWSPIHPSLNLPFYIIALGLLAFGFLLGSLMSWLGSLPVRWQKRKQGRRIQKLEKELNSAREKEKTVLHPANDITLLPAKMNE